LQLSLQQPPPRVCTFLYYQTASSFPTYELVADMNAKLVAAEFAKLDSLCRQIAWSKLGIDYIVCLYFEQLHKPGNCSTY
jgi:hypothetical protein